MRVVLEKTSTDENVNVPAAAVTRISAVVVSASADTKPMMGAGCPKPVQTPQFGVVAVTVNPHLVYVVNEAAPAPSKPSVQGVSARGGVLAGVDAEESDGPQ